MITKLHLAPPPLSPPPFTFHLPLPCLAIKHIIIVFCMMISSVAWSADKRVWQSEEYSYRTVTIADKLNQPWSLVFLPDKSILIAEKPGTISRVTFSGKTYQTSRIAFLPEVTLHGQGGFMDLTLHPDFATNGFIYYSYTAASGDLYGTRVGRFQWKDGNIKNKKNIFNAQNMARGGRHFGSRIVFDDKKRMYLSLGERGDPAESQNLKNHFGTVVRISDEGQPIKDNPFMGKANALPEIYSYGHRNPQGLIFAQGKLWLHEHGARGGDELNIVKKGANYGWPTIAYGKNYSGTKIGEGTHKKGMEQPIVYWDPSIAPSGMIMYNGGIFPKWKGDVFIGALAKTHLRRLNMKGERVVAQEELLQDIGRIREVAQDDVGYIYVLTDSVNGKLLRLEPLTKPYEN